MCGSVSVVPERFRLRLANEIDNGRKSCYIPVQASGSGDPGSSVTLILSGEMPCPPSQLAACKAFEQEVGNSSSQVSLSVPYPPETTAPEPTAVKPTASTSAAASSSSADKLLGRHVPGRHVPGRRRVVRQLAWLNGRRLTAHR